MSELPDYQLALEEAAKAAAKAEDSFRSTMSEQMAQLERERIFAFRRSHLMKALSKAMAHCEDETEACEKGREQFIAETELDPQNAAHQAIIERFEPVLAALDEVLNMEGEIDKGAPLATLKAFEDWYRTEKDQPFMALFDVYIQETPRVDF